MDDYKNIEYIKRHQIGLDETFAFECLQCGSCCRHREDLMLTGPDLYRISSALGISVRDVIEQYCETYIGRNSNIPVCRLKPIGKNHACPLLKNSRCAVHKSKPILCGLFPLGRYFDDDGKAVYFLTRVSDHARGKTYTVREWLTLGNVPLEDEAAPIWQEMVRVCVIFMRNNQSKITTRGLNIIAELMYQILYVSYFPQIPLIEQMQAGLSSLTDALPRLAEKYKK